MIPKHSIFDCSVKKKKKRAEWKRYKATRLSEEKKTTLVDFVEEMLPKGYIYPMASVAISNILLAKRPNRKYLTFID
jgi:hypothetical protein